MKARTARWARRVISWRTNKASGCPQAVEKVIREGEVDTAVSEIKAVDSRWSWAPSDKSLVQIRQLEKCFDLTGYDEASACVCKEI